MNRLLAASLLSLTIATAALAGVKHIDAPTRGTVNINTAAVAQLALLPYVGEVIAGRIADYRAAHGQFHRASDLLQVKGIGAKRFAKMAPYVVVAGPTTAGAKIKGGAK